MNIIQAEIYYLNVGHILLIDAKEFTCVVQTTLHGASLAIVVSIIVLLIALSNILSSHVVLRYYHTVSSVDVHT